MQFIAKQVYSIPMASAAVLVVSAFLMLAAVWWCRRRSVVPYQPRRPVPWQAFDVAMVVMFYVAFHAGVVGVLNVVLGSDVMQTSAVGGLGDIRNEHIVAQLMAEADGWTLLLCVVSAALVAPISEEFFFRVLLQGWCEAFERRWRRWIPAWRRFVPRGVGPIVPIALLFAAMHFRIGAPRAYIPLLVFFLGMDAIGRLLTMLFAIGLLRWRVGATAADLGWMPAKTRSDIRLGLKSFAAIAAPLFAMQISLHFLLPEHVAPDPLPLFFLALLLGTLYYRTHRIMPLIALHASLNGASLVLAWLGS